MAILPILEVPDARLRRISAPVTEVTDEIRTLVADMFETMYAAPGIGLAAAQVDQPIRLLVMDLGDGPADEDGKGTRNPRVFINPEIQHEIDHLDGILFIDHLSRLKRDMVLKKLEKARSDKARRKAA